jgi:ubiquinone/menaquinone biosynthesis C-methylase UbiE
MKDAGPNSAAAREARYFDDLVSEVGDFNPLQAGAWATLRRRFATAVQGRTGLALLDVGCGTGHSRQVYVDHCASYSGIDLSLGALRLASRREPGSWLRADACQLPFPSASLDVVAFSSVLHHIPERRVALAEACRVLKPGGLALAFDPNLWHPAMALFRHPASPLYRREGVSPDERPLLPSALRRDFKSAGFASIRQRCQSNLPYRAVAPRGISAFLPLFNRLDLVWERMGLGRVFGTFVITWASVPGVVDERAAPNSP